MGGRVAGTAEGEGDTTAEATGGTPEDEDAKGGRRGAADGGPCERDGTSVEGRASGEEVAGNGAAAASRGAAEGGNRAPFPVAVPSMESTVKGERLGPRRGGGKDRWGMDGEDGIATGNEVEGG